MDNGWCMTQQTPNSQLLTANRHIPYAKFHPPTANPLHLPPRHALMYNMLMMCEVPVCL